MSTPTGPQILTTAHHHGYGTVTPTQAQHIAEQIQRWGGGDVLEVLLFAAREAHTANLAMMGAAMVEDPGIPEGFEDAEVSEFYPQLETGVLTRYIDLEVPAHCRNGFVKLSIVDEIVDGRVVRRAPVAIVAAEDEFTRDDLLSLADALIVAARMLPAD